VSLIFFRYFPATRVFCSLLFFPMKLVVVVVVVVAAAIVIVIVIVIV
jgi:hypothetical protein